MPKGAGTDGDLVPEERAVGIYITYPDGERFASGMLVSADLVLTALHNFVRKPEAVNGEVDPRLPKGWKIHIAFVSLAAGVPDFNDRVKWWDASLVWPTEPMSWHACDLALLRLTRPGPPIVPLMVAGAQADTLALSGHFFGFPRIKFESEKSIRPEDRLNCHFWAKRASYEGKLTSFDKVRSRRVFTSANRSKTPPGISGSVVLHQEATGSPTIIGVVSSLPSAPYVELTQGLGRDGGDLVVALLESAVGEHDDLCEILAASGIHLADTSAPSDPLELHEHVALIDREDTCAVIAAAIGRPTEAAAGTGPRWLLTIGYLGEDAPHMAIDAIARKLPDCVRAVARRQRATAPTVVVEASSLTLRMPQGSLPLREVENLIDHLKGELGRGPAILVVPIIVTGEIAGPREVETCLGEMRLLLEDIARFAAPIVLLLFIERHPGTPEGRAIHARLCAGAADLPASFGDGHFMGDLEWIDSLAIVQWGAALMQVPELMRWSHVVKRRVSDLERRVYRIHAECPEHARAYPRLRRVVELIVEIQTPSPGKTP